MFSKYFFSIFTSFAFGLIISASTKAFAEEEIKGAVLTNAIFNLLEKSEISKASIHQGWVVTVAILRCSNPQETIDPNDKEYCALDTIDSTTSDEEPIMDSALIDDISDLLENSSMSEFFIGQGWYVHAAIVRCYNPIGTGKSSDKLYCALGK